VGTSSTAKRRRRSPEQARAEIVEAAHVFLRERPFRELTVDEVMAATGLSRPSFYVYFRDRHQLLLSIVEEIGAELFAMAERWLRGGGDPVADARAALEGVAAVYAEHGIVLRAIAEAAGTDPEVEAMYRALVQRFVDATAEHIGDEVAGGRIAPVDARETALALVWMNERYFIERLATPPVAPVASVVETLLTVWVRTLYERSP
jgi:AcrR family transcriptional regulator